MTAAKYELHGNLRVDVFDELGGRLLGHAMLRIEPAPLSGHVRRARLEPDPPLRLGAGPHYLRLPSGEGWQVELQPDARGVTLAVAGSATPTSAAVGGE